LLLELNRFTINSINHNAASRQAYRDDGGGTPTSGRNYWLRSAGLGYEQDATFRTVATVNTAGIRNAGNAHHTLIGFRPPLPLNHLINFFLIFNELISVNNSAIRHIKIT